MKQKTLAMAADQSFENYRKPNRRDEFLKTMEAIVPWAALCAVIEAHYPKAGASLRSLRADLPWPARLASALNAVFK